MNKRLVRERYKLLASIEELLEGPMIFLGFVWLVLLIIELVWGINRALEYASISIWVIFILDFLMKLILAPSRSGFLKSNWLTAISLIVPAIRVLKAFRVLRLVRGLRGIRLVRIVSSMNRSMKSLAATMKRRAFGYVSLLSVVVTLAGAAGMYGLENPNPGFDSYGMALWWTAMRIVTAGSDFWPQTPEGRSLAFLLSLFGYGIFGYITATLATFFIGRDAEESRAPIAGAQDIAGLKAEVSKLIRLVEEINNSGKKGKL